MNFRPRHLLIRFLMPRVWMLSEAQKLRVLLEFAQTELDSAWQSIYALQHVRDPALRGLLLQHAYEELFHSDLFGNMAARKATSLPAMPLTRREPLLNLEAGDLRSSVEFFAFLAVGESEIRRDFGAYESAIPDADVRNLFGRIRKDEDYHAEGTTTALTGMAAKAGINLRLIWLRHLLALAGKRYVSLMGKVGAVPMTAFLFVAFFLFGGLMAGQARERLRLGGDQQLKLLRRQQKRFDESLGGPA